jgi:hypothetical protein
MKKYSSLEEYSFELRQKNFITKWWKLHFGNEYNLVCQQVWDNYFFQLSEEEKKIALRNQEYYKKYSYVLHEHPEVDAAISESARRLSEKLNHCNIVKDVNTSLYHGGLELAVFINESTDLLEARKIIPSYFEGWYVRLHYSFTKIEGSPIDINVNK